MYITHLNLKRLVGEPEPAVYLNRNMMLPCSTAVSGRVVCNGDMSNDLSATLLSVGDITKMSTLNDGLLCVIAKNRSAACFCTSENSLCLAYKLVKPPDLGPVIDVAAGLFYVCAIKADNSNLVCWSDDAHVEADVPTGLGKVLALSTGAHHACVLLANNTGICWVVDPTQERVSAPMSFPGRFVSIVAGDAYQTCVLYTDRTSQCWGGSFDTHVFPQLPAIKVAQVGTPRERFHCVLAMNGTVLCVGDEACYNGIQVAGPMRVISTGYCHVCALTVSGLLQCFGADNSTGATWPSAALTRPGATLAVTAGTQRTCVFVPLRKSSRPSVGME